MSEGLLLMKIKRKRRQVWEMYCTALTSSQTNSDRFMFTACFNTLSVALRQFVCANESQQGFFHPFCFMGQTSNQQIPFLFPRSWKECQESKVTSGRVGVCVCVCSFMNTTAQPFGSLYGFNAFPLAFSASINHIFSVACCVY